jgi:hypothetical protein
MSAIEINPLGQPDSVGAWMSWFAWIPVRLYMSPRMAWLRVIYRRNVRIHGISSCDYTDQPDEYPCPAAEP